MKKSNKILLSLIGLSTPIIAGVSLISCGKKEKLNDFARRYLISKENTLINYDKSTKTFDLSKEDIKSIPAAAFSFQSINLLKYPEIKNFLENVEKVILPNNVEVIGKGAFLGLGIKEFVFNTTSSKLKTIEQEAFKQNKLQNLVLPSSIKEIHEEAFYGNEISNVNLPDLKELKKLSIGVFAENKLTTINLSNINAIEPSALALNSFVELELPANLNNCSPKLFFFSGEMKNVQKVKLKVLNEILKKELKNSLTSSKEPLYFEIID
ncbi:leucine-rich repeat domain-containing protein [Mycoplasma enhydrae]|uniref:leucine-rich repeat domain-containing protein n=1 Tax=Mycoplasma enhydrae TaxID=2499220 RepID=UPI0021E88D34|nr:leucine-rich repeat domain-containing protein [Mycoplasma enhydrae]MCV3753309.1 leucine-rich repeat domain-containing protein [Mycoplasma enhydrae]